MFGASVRAGTGPVDGKTWTCCITLREISFYNSQGMGHFHDLDTLTGALYGPSVRELAVLSL